MKIIYDKKFNILLTNNFSTNIDIPVASTYCIEVRASAKSWWQNTVSGRVFLKKDSATLLINTKDIPPISKKRKLFADDLWNGNSLKGVTQTVYVAASFRAGTQKLSFVVHGKPMLSSIRVYLLERQTLEISGLKAEKRDRAPWLVFMAYQEVAFRSVTINAFTEKSKQDDNDIQLKIDGEIVKNERSKAHTQWFWCGKILKGRKKEFRKDFAERNRSPRIDIIADGTPHIENIRITIEKKLTFFKKQDVQPYTCKGLKGKEDYNRFDGEIIDAVNEWNRVFNDEYPSPEPLHPNLVKAMIYVESTMGYFTSPEYPSYPDVMQVADLDNPAIHTLNNDGWRNKKGTLARERWWRDGTIHVLDYGGKANGSTSRESIYWGVRWLYHKNQAITTEGTRSWKTWKEAVAFYNGGGNPTYSQEVYDVYLNGIDKRNSNHIRLFLLVAFVLLSAGLVGIFHGVHAIPLVTKNITEVESAEDIGEMIEMRARRVVDEKMKIYKKQNMYYYGELFSEALSLCERHWQQCSPDYVFYPYFSDLVRYARRLNAVLESARSLDIVTSYNSSLGDFDNDGVNELAVVLDDTLNHEYLDVIIVDQVGEIMHRAEQKISRPYIGNPPRIVDVTGDGVPEIIVFSTGGRQDIQAYIFQYGDGTLYAPQVFERGYLRADFIFTDQNGNHVPEIMIRGEQYGDECMACNHATIEEVFEYDVTSKKFLPLSSKIGARKDDIERNNEH